MEDNKSTDSKIKELAALSSKISSSSTRKKELLLQVQREGAAAEENRLDNYRENKRSGNPRKETGDKNNIKQTSVNVNSISSFLKEHREPVGRMEARGKSITKYEANTKALIEKSRLLAQQIKEVQQKAKIEIARLKSSVEMITSQRDIAIKEIENKNTHIRTQKFDFKAMTEKNDFLSMQLKQTKEKLDENTEQLEECKKLEYEWKCKMEASNNETVNLNENVKNLETLKDGLTAQLEQKQEVIEKLNNTIREISAEKSRIERDTNQKKMEEIVGLKNKVELFTSQQESGKKELESLKEMVGKKESEKKTLEEKNKFVTVQLTQMEKKLDETLEKLAAAQKREVALSMSVEAKRKEAEGLSSKVAQLEKTHREFVSRMQENRVTLEKLSGELEAEIDEIELCLY